MTPTTDVQSGISYMAHPLALVESDEIGEGTRIWAFAHVMKNARIGCGCNIGEHCYIEQGVTLGNNVTVKNGVNVWRGVTIEDDVFLGPNCVLTNDPNPRAYDRRSQCHNRLRRGYWSVCLHRSGRSSDSFRPGFCVSGG